MAANGGVDAGETRDLMTILSGDGRNFLVRNNGDQVPVSELEGKVVGLYFFWSYSSSCQEFTPILVEMYGKLKEKGENVEVVLVFLDDDEPSFELAFVGMPWLAVPFKDKSCDRLVGYFDVAIPTLVVIGPTGKTLHANAVELVEEHGMEAYPFSPKKLEELVKARMEAQTLESLLVSKERDYVIGKDGVKVPVSELVGKNILLYFSVNEWYRPCRDFLPKLIEAYHKIKNKDSAFEVIFVSTDQDRSSSFDEFFLRMPWLALPFGDKRVKFLSRMFKIYRSPSLVAIGPTGKTITKEARDLMVIHGAEAYPFTEDRIKELEAELEEIAKRWPEKLRHALHEKHELVRTGRMLYLCDKCEEEGAGWSFYCQECDFDLHLKCSALEEDHKVYGCENQNIHQK